MIRRPPSSTLFPDTTLFRSVLSGRSTPCEVWEPVPHMPAELRATLNALWERYDDGGEMAALRELEELAAEHKEDAALTDRKSTRLNSSPRQYLVCRLLLETKPPPRLHPLAPTSCSRPFSHPFVPARAR